MRAAPTGNHHNGPVRCRLYSLLSEPCCHELRGGTGDGYVLVKFSAVLREIENLRDVAKGFIEIFIYKNLMLEILSKGGDAYYLIKDRDDAGREVLEKDVLVRRVWRFLTE
jgi:hypothetical protein